MSGQLLLALVLAGVWCAIRGEITLPQFLLGLAAGLLFTTVAGLGRGRVTVGEIPRRAVYLCLFIVALLYDVVRSNLDLAWRLARPRPLIHPGVVRVRLGSVVEATARLEAHAITVAPGQMVVDYGEDGRTIYVHMIDVGREETARSTTWRRYRELLQKVFS